MQTKAATKWTSLERRAGRKEAPSQARDAPRHRKRRQLQRTFPRQHTSEDARTPEPHAQEHSRLVETRGCG